MSSLTDAYGLDCCYIRLLPADSQQLTLLQSSAISSGSSKLTLPPWTDPTPADFASTSTYT